MLHRAASNAYSWWWASHLRTKQSKWLEQNLQDMEEKVQSVLQLIDEDGDSFAKRAEMYYRKRPELINFVEESYRAYRALADRYDHMSTDLQKANNTIAYVFPEQVQFAMEEEQDEPSPIFPKKPQHGPKTNIPKVPKIPEELKGFISTTTKKLQTKKPKNAAAAATTRAKSGLNKTEGVHEIDRLQKQILALQTEKEFVKISYENGLTKYLEIDQEIRELQDKVCGLKDEFGAGIVIEDEEARSLMASVALKSFQDTLVQLRDKQVKSEEEAMVEHKRIEQAREKMKSLKDKILQVQLDGEKPQAKDEPMKAVLETKSSDQEMSNVTHEEQHWEVLCDKIKEHFEVSSTLTVTELTEKIDEHAQKVISLEAGVSSQTALIQTLTSETDQLQAQIRILEDEKSTLIDGKKDLNDKLKEMEDKLHELQSLDRTVEVQNSNLQTHFTEAQANLDNISEKLHSLKPEEEDQNNSLTQMGCLGIVGTRKEMTGLDVASKPNNVLGNLPDAKPEEDIKFLSGSDAELKRKEVHKEVAVLDSPEMVHEASAEIGIIVKGKNQSENEPHCSTSQKSNIDNLSQPNTGYVKVEDEASSGSMNNPSPEETKKQETGQEEEPDWKRLFMSGMENREKVLLTEYTSILRNLKEMKKKLTEQENKGGKSLFDITVQLKELKSANAKKDQQIQILRQKLNLLQAGSGEEKESGKSTVTGSPITNKDVELNLRELLIGEPSEIEEKFRANIDEVLEENLDFWMRFSSTFQQIQKFEAEVKDWQSDSVKLEEKLKKQDASNAPKYSLKSDAKPLYKHLREMHNELTVWIEKSTLLKDEMKSRFSSLCDIEEEIIAALKESAVDEGFRFTSFQAAKFQGEILNMKKENNKVADELQAGLDHVITLQLQVERSLAKLNEIFKLSGSKNCSNIQLEHSESRFHVPLGSFIFRVKPKRQRPSLFSCIHPGFHRKYHGVRSTPDRVD